MLHKILAVALCLGLLLCLAGCGDDTPASSDSGAVSVSENAQSQEASGGEPSEKNPNTPKNPQYPFDGTEVSSSLFENGFTYMEAYEGWSFCARFSGSEIKLEGKEGYTVKLAARPMPKEGLPSGNWTHYEAKLLENYVLTDGYLLRLESEDFRTSMADGVTYEVCIQLHIGNDDRWGIIHMGK